MTALRCMLPKCRNHRERCHKLCPAHELAQTASAAWWQDPADPGAASRTDSESRDAQERWEQYAAAEVVLTVSAAQARFKALHGVA